jgi:hypothetical protein
MIFRALMMICQIATTTCQIQEDPNSPYKTIEECNTAITEFAKQVVGDPPNIIISCLKMPSELKVTEYPDVIRQMMVGRLDEAPRKEYNPGDPNRT